MASNTAKGDAQVTLRGRFPAGTSAKLARRVADSFYHGGVSAIATAKVSKDSEVTFKNLPDGGQYWVFAEVDGAVRHAAVTAKVPPVPKERVERPGTFEARPFESGSSHTVKRPARAPARLHERLHQRDVPAGVLQRSATPLGMATPKDPKELTPGLPQSEVPKGVVQRSDTPQGVATVKPSGDEAPEVKQEDVSGLQRSDTPTGAAAPKPSRRQSAVEADKDRDAEPSQKALREGPEKVSRSRSRSSSKSTTRRSRTNKEK